MLLYRNDGNQKGSFMKNVYLETHQKKDCNGCGVCVLECPVNAMAMVQDEEGFLYPKIDREKCINCGKCKQICSNDFTPADQQKVYMAVNRNSEERKNSTSGGVFFLLAKWIIAKGGVVFGVEYGKDLVARHNFYETLEECKNFQGSKYVRSDTGDVYRKAKTFLEQGRWVLFTGTPCQCSGLRTYLRRDYENLILCDIICHANPSPRVLSLYLQEIEKKYGRKVVQIQFRDKEKGWRTSKSTLTLEGGKTVNDSLFRLAFLCDLINRPSCSQCKFSTPARASDFTIGDFWGVEKVVPDVMDDDMGISFLLRYRVRRSGGKWTQLPPGSKVTTAMCLSIPGGNSFLPVLTECPLSGI